MPAMRACACGLRTTTMLSVPARIRSSVNRPPPVIRRGSSRRWILAPTICVIAIRSGPPCRSADQDACAGLDGLARRLDRPHDIGVAGAAAEVALEAFADVSLARPRIP